MGDLEDKTEEEFIIDFAKDHPISQLPGTLKRLRSVVKCFFFGHYVPHLERDETSGMCWNCYTQVSSFREKDTVTYVGDDKPSYDELKKTYTG